MLPTTGKDDRPEKDDYSDHGMPPPPPTSIEKREKLLTTIADELSAMAKSLTEFESATIAIQRLISALEEVQTLRTRELRKHTKQDEPGEDIL